MRSTILALVLVGLISTLCACAFAADAIPVEVHGYMLNRAYVGPGANPEFRSERISVSAVASFPEKKVAYVEAYYHPWAPASGLYLESAYFDTPAGEGRLRVGKGRRLTFGITPSYPNRKTSNYGIVAEAFTQDRIQGLQYTLQKGAFDFGIDVQTALRLGTRGTGEISGDGPRNATHSVPHLSLRDLPGELSNKLEVSTRIGGKWSNGLRADVSYSLSSLDARDLRNLTTPGTATAPNPLAPGALPTLLPLTSTDRSRTMWGLDFLYKRPCGGFVAQAELYMAETGDLEWNAWDALIGWEPADTSKWRFYARYSQQNMDVTPTANPLSWDQQQLSLSMVQPISKTVWLQYEFERNMENPAPGFAEVKNDLFFIELFTGF